MERQLDKGELRGGAGRGGSGHDFGFGVEEGRWLSHDAVRRTTDRAEVDAVLHVVLLQLGEDVFAVRVLPQGLDVGPDLGRQGESPLVTPGFYRETIQCSKEVRLKPGPATKKLAFLFVPLCRTKKGW